MSLASIALFSQVVLITAGFSVTSFVHNYVTSWAWTSSCTWLRLSMKLCMISGDWSSGWGQLWSVPCLEMTWHIPATSSTSWWKLVPSADGRAEHTWAAMVSKRDGSWVNSLQWWCQHPAAHTTTAWYVPSYHRPGKKHSETAREPLMCPYCMYPFHPKVVAFSKRPSLGQVLGYSCRRCPPSTMILHCKQKRCRKI